MEINPSEVTKILKEQIKKLGDRAEVSEVGQVLSVGQQIKLVQLLKLQLYRQVFLSALLIFLLLLKDLFPFMPLSFVFEFVVIYF